jgi:putative pyruvate formate lyase activating enzyme
METEALTALYDHCILCPRRCGVNRNAGERGFCGETAALRLASASIHRGEEPPITGTGGSGTIFVSGCGLRCVFCQNHQISQGKPGFPEAAGRAVSPEEFARICHALEERGAENINIVTGSHAVPAILRGILRAREEGLRLPLLWNSSSYESPQALDLLSDQADLYLPDLKTLDPALAARYFDAPAYPKHAAAAIGRMMENRARSGRPPAPRPGVIIRHLILPGCLESTRGVLEWFVRHAQGRALLSLMTQYTPIDPPGSAAPRRFLHRAEYERVLAWLEELGIEDGFYQELVSGSDWLPDFRRPNPFSSDLSVPVWHWTKGLIGRGSAEGA